MEALNRLFGGAGIVKILKLFLLNEDGVFTAKEVSRRSKVPQTTVRSELKMLADIKFIKQKIVTEKGRKQKGFFLNKEFSLLVPLNTLLVHSIPYNKDDILARFKKAGKIKLLVFSGVFIQDPSSRVDMLIVGDYLSHPKLENVIRHIEAEVGTELSYTICDTEDFKYRINSYDKFVRDVLDYPHEILLDKLGVE